MREGHVARPKVRGLTITPRGHRRRLIAISLALLFVLGLFPLPQIARADWLSGYGYRKSHAITGSTAGAQTNYQVMITVHYGSGTDSGGDVYCNSLCQTNFGDIRFTNGTGRSQLDYWMQTETDGVSATFWVEVPSILASPSTTTIYVYYGRSGATTTSNGTKTFIFYDDAQTDKSSGYTLVDIYNTGMTATLTYNSGSKQYEITHTAPAGDEEFVKINGLSLAQLEIWGKLNLLVGGAGGNNQFGLLIRDTSSGRYYARACTYFSPDQLLITGNSGANPSTKEKTLSTASYSGDVITTNTWYQVKMNAYGSSLWASTDLESKSTSATNSTFPGPGNCGIVMGFDTASKVAFKNIVVRNYCSPEPAHGSWGSPESAPSTPFAFADGGSVAIGTGATVIATLATPFTSGNNFVLAIVQFQSTATAKIAPSGLYLERVGGNTLMSNSYSIVLISSVSFSQKWYALMGIDTSPGYPSNPSYDVVASANVTGISGEAKIMAINGVTGSEAQSASDVTIGTSETTLVNLSPSLAAGDNIVFTIFEAHGNRAWNTSNYTISYLRLKRGATVLADNIYNLYVGKFGSGTGTSASALQVHFFPFLDGGVSANPTYTATGKSNTGSYVTGKAKIVAFSRGWWYACFGNGSTSIQNPQPGTTIETLATNIPQGSDAIAIASEQISNSATTATNSIFAGEDRLQQNDNATSQTVNEYTLTYTYGQKSDDGKGFALLNEFYPTPSAPTYKVKARAYQTPGTINGEAKILVLGFNIIHPAPEFPYGAFVPLAIAFAAPYILRKVLKRE